MKKIGVKKIKNFGVEKNWCKKKQKFWCKKNWCKTKIGVTPPPIRNGLLGNIFLFGGVIK